MRLLNENRFNRLDVLVLVTIILIGLVKLPQPFLGDQALSTIMASKISRGGIIYRDLWDLKLPGIFIFYLVGGTLFGFDEVGIHAFELLYMLTFSIILILAMKDYFKSRSVASLTPLFTVGIYYGISGTWHQTQTEALVGFPMFLSLWYACKSSQSASSRVLRLFLSGFMGGMVLLFKLVFLPILIAFWFTAFYDAVIRRKEHLLSALFRVGVPITLGVLLPLLVIFGYFVRHDMLDLVHWTFFEYPTRIMIDSPLKIYKLADGLLWFIEKFAPLMALGVIGAYASLGNRKNFMTVNLILWSILGFGVILIQRISWWQYHYLLLSVPLGLLTVQGLDIFWSHLERLGPSIPPRQNRIVALLSLALLFLPIISSLAATGLSLARDDFAIERERRLKYQIKVNPAHQTMLQEVAFLSEPTSLSGDIYVFGDPLYYYFSGRDPAIPLLATWFTSLPEQWARLFELLDEARPPYIFVSTKALDAVRKYTPKVAPYIDQTIPNVEKNYSLLRASDAGIWYVLQDKSKGVEKRRGGVVPAGLSLGQRASSAGLEQEKAGHANRAGVFDWSRNAYRLDR